MEGGMDQRRQLSETRTQSLVDIHILVVDDDATSLAVVSAMLKICRYQVVTVKNPLEALHTLRARKGLFDLIVTDLHMPQMDGLQLQKHVKEEFKLPVIIMSADEKPSVILKSLEEGVAFYMVKPITLDDLKHVWQYAITAKKVLLDQTRTFVQRADLSSLIKKSSFKDTSSSTFSLNEEKRVKSKKRKVKEYMVYKNSITIRKPKVVWTNSLHNQFLHAIKQIGLDKAVPKRILEFMNVPGLTRENIASHLQKYRIFLKRVAEKGAASLKDLPEYRLLRSSFASAHFPPPIYREKSHSQYPYFAENHQMGPSLTYQPVLGGNFSADLSPTNPNLEGASMAYLGNEQSNLLNNQAQFRLNSFVHPSWTQDDQNFIFMETEINGFDSNLNPTGTTTAAGEDHLVSQLGRNGLCSNVQVSNDVNNGGGGRLFFNGAFAAAGKEPFGCMDGGAFSGQFDGTNNQLLQMISDTNLQGNAASVLIPSEGGQNVGTWKENNNTIAFGDIAQEHDCFGDLELSEVFLEENHKQRSNLWEQGGEEELHEDLSEIWNQIELMDASAKEVLHPSHLSAKHNQSWEQGSLSQDWEEGLLEMLFGFNSP